MLGYKGPAQPSPNTRRRAERWLSDTWRCVCLGCDTHQTVALDIVRRSEDDTDTRVRAVHALQGLLTGSRLSVQAESSGSVATDEDICDGRAVNVVAGER